MEEGVFEKIGLTPGERKVYLALLGWPPVTTGVIIKETGLQRSAVYFCLDRLMEKGLASFFLKNNVKYFEAARPEKLLAFLEDKEGEIEQQKEEVRRLLPSLERRAAKAAEVRGTRLFDGWEGMRSAFDDILITLKPGDDYLVLGVATVPAVLDRFRRFIAKFHAKRWQKKIRCNVIVDEVFRETIGKDRQKEPLTDVRFISKEYTAPAVVNIYANKVLIALWTEKPSAFIVESKEVADSFRNYFRLLWKMARKA